MLTWEDIVKDARLLPRRVPLLSYGRVGIPQTSDGVTRAFEVLADSAACALDVRLWTDQVPAPGYLMAAKGVQVGLEDVFCVHDPSAALERALELRKDADRKGETYRLWPASRYDTKSAPTRELLAGFLEAVVPLLNDLERYQWQVLRELAAELRIRSVFRFNEQGADDIAALIYDFIDACAFVFGCKWEIGAGETWKSPDPNDLSYPRTSKDWRLEWTWSADVEPMIEDQISTELGLQYHWITCWRSDSGVPHEEYERRCKEYFESGKHDEELRLIHQEMESRVITFEAYVRGSACDFPDSGQYHSLAEVLETKMAQGSEISVGTLHSILTVTMGDIWNEYYGGTALIHDFDYELGRWVERVGRRLARYHFSAEPKLVSYRLLERIENAIHRLVRQRLENHFGSSEADWYVRGFPDKLRAELAGKREYDSDREEAVAYMDLIDFKSVVEKNWVLFEDVFGAECWGGKQRRARLSGFERLNRIRRPVGHPIRRGISLDEYRFLEELDKSLPLDVC